MRDDLDERHELYRPGVARVDHLQHRSFIHRVLHLKYWSTALPALVCSWMRMQVQLHAWTCRKHSNGARQGARHLGISVAQKGLVGGTIEHGVKVCEGANGGSVVGRRKRVHCRCV